MSEFVDILKLLNRAWPVPGSVYLIGTCADCRMMIVMADHGTWVHMVTGKAECNGEARETENGEIRDNRHAG